MSTSSTIKIKVHVRWWVKHYLAALHLVACLSGRTPDVERVSRFIVRRGIRIYMEGKKS